MKLATYKNGRRDGKLMVVKRDLSACLDVSSIAANMQNLLDNWNDLSPAVEAKFEELETGRVAGDAFDLAQVLAPLPRAYEWIDGSAYINHIVLVRKARGAEPPATLRTDPLVYQGGSGVFLSCIDDIALADQSWGLDFESEVVVVLDDVPQGIKASEVEGHIKLIGLCNDISLRNLIPAELQKGFGFFNSKPASSFSPVFVTPNEVEGFWQDGRLNLPMLTFYNGEKFGDPNAGPEMFFSFHQLVEHIAKTRSFTAGTIIGSGTVSNEDRDRGSSCLAEKRMIEKIEQGEITTAFMKPGDTVEIEMNDPSGQSIFGRISQKVVKK